MLRDERGRLISEEVDPFFKLMFLPPLDETDAGEPLGRTRAKYVECPIPIQFSI
jgi:hypothetical protein